MNKSSVVPAQLNPVEPDVKEKDPVAKESTPAKAGGNSQHQAQDTHAQVVPKVKHDDKEPVADKDHPSAKPHEYRQEHVQHTQEATHAAIKPQPQAKTTQEQKKS